MQIVLSRIRTRFAVSIFYNDNHYTTSASSIKGMITKKWKAHIATWGFIFSHLSDKTTSWRSSALYVPHSYSTCLSTPSHGRAKAGWPAQTYIQQLCEDTGYSPEDLLGVMNNTERWRERVKDIRADGTTWWWWWFFMK